MGLPIIRTLVFWGPYWGPLILGNYQMGTGFILGFEGSGFRVKGWGFPCKDRGTRLRVEALKL